MTALPAPGAVGSRMVVSGTLTLDTIERDGVRHADIPGGSALYGAAAARLVLPTRIVGTVGTDFPFDALAPLWAHGVDRSGIEVLDGPTFRWHARYERDGDTRLTISRARGVAEQRRPPVARCDDHEVALLLGSTDPRIQGHVRAAHPNARLVGLDSMIHWWREFATALAPLLAQVNVVFVDEEELALAVDTADAQAGAELLMALGAQVVVVKRGSRGAWMQRRGCAPIAITAVPLARAIDPTGAGDAFAGAFVASLARWPERGDTHALRLAAAVASFAVEAAGIGALCAADEEVIARRMAALDLTEG